MEQLHLLFGVLNVRVNGQAVRLRMHILHEVLEGVKGAHALVRVVRPAQRGHRPPQADCSTSHTSGEVELAGRTVAGDGRHWLVAMQTKGGRKVTK
jgi:hypothetical protein